MMLPKHTVFFDDKEINYGDLMKINPHDLPYFDLMIAGFPCQTFSIAGKGRFGRSKRFDYLWFNQDS